MKLTTARSYGVTVNRLAAWSRTTWFLWVVSIVAVCIFARDLIGDFSNLGAFGDIRYFHFLWQVARTTWVEFAQVPLWNPYYCGGMVDLANAQSMALFPTNLLSALTDAGTGMRLHILIHMVIAFAGMACWAKTRGLGVPWCFAPALAFAMSGFFSERATGHVSFMAFAWIPWILLTWDAARDAARWAWVGGALIAACVYDGSPYATSFSILLVAALATTDAMARVITSRRLAAAARPLGLAMLFATAFVCVSAFKLVPILEFLSAHPRAIPQADDSLNLMQFWEIFMRREIRRHAEGYTYVFGEYRNYVGPLVLGGAALALVVRRARGREIAVAGLFAALCLGHHGPFSPYAALHEVPIFSSLRVPSRFAILVLPFVALWFGEALAWLASRPSRRVMGLIAAVGLLIATTIDLGSVNARMLDGFFNTPVPTIDASQSFHQIGGRGGAQWRAPLENRGVVRCYEPNSINVASTLRRGRVSQVTVLPASAGTSELTRFSPNHLELKASLRVAGTVIVNQNFDRGWQCSVGEIVEQGGRLGVVLPPGEHVLTLSYQPTYSVLLALLSALGLFATLLASRANNPRLQSLLRGILAQGRRWPSPRARSTAQVLRRVFLFESVGFALAKAGALLSAGEGLSFEMPVAIIAGLRDDLVVICVSASLIFAVLKFTAQTSRAHTTIGWCAMALAWLVGAYSVANLYFVQLYGAPLSVDYLVYGAAIREAPAFIEWPALTMTGLGLIVYGAVTLGVPLLNFSRTRHSTRLPARRLFVGGAAMVALLSVTLPRGPAARLGQDRNALLMLFDVGAASEAVQPPTREDIEELWASWPAAQQEPPKPVDWDRKTKPPRHLVLWMAEGVGTRYLDLFGADEETTPNLSALKNHSVRFDRYYTNVPISIKAIFNMLCGAYPYPDSGFITEIKPRIACPSLMEELTAAGWDAALFHGGFFAFTNKLKFLGQRGFDLMLDAASVPDRDSYFTNGWGIDDAALVAHGLDWLDERDPDQSTLAVFIPITPHFPYFLPPGASRPFAGDDMLARYRNGVHYTDQLFGDLVAGYRSRGLAEDTLFVFVGDHGQAFFQHARNRLHGGFIYEENVHSPLILISERLFPSEQLSHRLGGHVDLLPTLLQLMGRPIPAGLPGQSLVASSFDSRPVMFSTHYQDKLVGLRDGPYKYIHNLRTGRDELYDLNVDPHEQSNLAASHQTRRHRYQSYLRDLTAWQRSTIDEASTLGESYLDRFVPRLHTSIIDEGRTKQCQQARPEGGTTCPDEASWIWVGPATLRVFNIERECLRVHPPKSGILRLRVEGMSPLPRLIGAGLTDSGARSGGTPVTVTWRIGSHEPITQIVSDRSRFAERAVPLGDETSGDLQIDIQTDRWHNRTTCLTLSP